MPRGDGTGPAGGGGRGSCRGTGRGQGQRMRRNLQAGVGNQMAQLPRTPAPTPSRDAIPVAHVDEETCTLCGVCQDVCPTEAISLGDTAVKVSKEACCGCGACVNVCPSGAIRID